MINHDFRGIHKLCLLYSAELLSIFTVIRFTKLEIFQITLKRSQSEDCL